MQKGSRKKQLRPSQHQSRPGSERKMRPQPVFDYPDKKGSEKLAGRVALITGGDSGIGKAVAVLFAKEGAEVAIAYLREKRDARDTASYIKSVYEKDCLLIPGNLGNENHCNKVIRKVIDRFGRLDILVNNAALHYENKELADLTTRELVKTFTTNILSFFWLTKKAVPLMNRGSSIINTSSVTAYRGSAGLIDYSSTKGAIVSFTRSLSASLVKKRNSCEWCCPGPGVDATDRFKFQREKSRATWKRYADGKSGRTRRDCAGIPVFG